ncbi:response regulator transcription factor [Fulvivirga sp. M361]|uniref:response regulator transcription factor n=1 Tax=Fulvivirga sp. M361 TaxID=2594266 RepID=UPI00117A40A3|nr:response regulator transcription factor [Fulvivirga sp. M361]TRX58865.1 response regulator transcription factor [Fulvivirga sp. M361]
MTRILLVDDHQLFAEGIKSIFYPEDEIKVVCEAKNGKEIPVILEAYEVASSHHI